MKKPADNGKPTLIVIRGLPGSGKSYYAQALRTALEAELGDDMVIGLDPDATDYDSPEYAEHVRQQTADGVDGKLHAYRFLRGQAQVAIENNQIIIWNQPFSNLDIFNKMVANLRTHASEQGTELQVLVVEVAIDPEVAFTRIVERKHRGGHGPSEQTFKRFIDDFYSFAKHGYATVAVSGEADAGEVVAAIKDALNSL